MTTSTRSAVLVTLALAAGAVLIALPFGWKGDPPGPAAAAARVLAVVENAGKGNGMKASDVEAALVALGPEATAGIEASLDAAPTSPYAPSLARALGRLSNDGALPAIGRLAKAPKPDVRRGAAMALATVQTRAGLDAALAMLADESPMVAHAAIETVVELDGAPTKLPARNEVGRLFDRGRNTMARVRAAQCVQRLGGPEAGAILERGLRDYDPDVRSASADALGRLGSADEGARSDLVAMLRDDRELEPRKQAALALGRLRERSACPTLIECLSAESSGLRGNAVWALRAISGYSFPEMPERWADWWKREGSRATATE